MSKENVDVVRRFESLMMTRDGLSEADRKLRLEQVMELLDENVAFRPSTTIPGHGGEWVGHDGFLGMCRAYAEIWHPPEDFKLELLDGGDDKVVILVTFTRTARATGWSTPIRMVEIVTVRDGKIVELVPYFHETVGMLEAARGSKLT